MTIEIAIDNKYFSIQYDEKYLDTIIKRLGLNSKHCNIYLKEAILYFSTGTNRVRTVYDILAEKYGKDYNTIVAHIRNGIERASADGRLARVNELFFGAVYDYSYGMTNKTVITIISSLMKMNGKIQVNEISGAHRD